MAVGRLELILTVASVLVLGLVYGCGGDVTVAVDTRIRAGAKEVDIGHLTRFDWDRLFVFGPYSYPRQICDDLGLTRTECSAAGFEDVDEGHYLLVFMKDSGISYRETFSRFTGNFDKSCLAKAIPKTVARFAVVRRSGGSVHLACPSSPNLSDALRRG